MKQLASDTLKAIWSGTRTTWLGRAMTRSQLFVGMLEHVYKFLHPPEIVAYETPNYRILIDTNDKGVGRRYLLEGEHEGFEKQYVLQHVSFRHFYDIGANIGDWSLYIAANHPICSITAFEPHPEIYARLQASIRMNKFGNIVAHNVALGAKEAELELLCDPCNQGNNTLVAANTPRNASKHKVRIEPVIKYITRQEQGGMLIKIDVQGYEYEILKTIVNPDILRHACFILEIDNSTSSETIAWLQERKQRGRKLVKLDERQRSAKELIEPCDACLRLSGSEYFDVLVC